MRSLATVAVSADDRGAEPDQPDQPDRPKWTLPTGPGPTLLLEADQRMVVYSAAAGTPAGDALALLRVVGVQQVGAAR